MEQNNDLRTLSQKAEHLSQSVENVEMIDTNALSALVEFHCNRFKAVIDHHKVFVYSIVHFVIL